MPNISEFHNDADVSFLSEVLEKDCDLTKYYLSSKACEGILRRAEKRKATLLPVLELALQVVADREQILNK
jgi:hypothetical protein